MKEQPEDILSLAIQQPALSDQVKLVEERSVKVKAGFDFRLHRYAYPEMLPVEDVGVVYYQPASGKKSQRVQLRYCMVGNRYCNNPACKNTACAKAAAEGGTPSDKQAVLDVISITLHPSLLDTLQATHMPDIFEKNGNRSFVKTIQPCTKTKIALEGMVHHGYDGMLQNIFLQSKALELLLYSSDQFIRNDPDEKYGCRFLTQVEDRDKIVQARDILLEHLDAPVTIRELARKVAMNECYLKKGFKAMYGTTIYDYFQKERMERARQLLYDRGLSVSEVAMMMGYSCISHFSTAFKKHTGLKPCELLLR
ncbi:AraC family transcriptional regulator [Compostibacter hankyongensis]|uniref:HTH araC/xylS-type domain-containing protein n=1 Tax=Compostibacter hankyongensis TaxID=1007089 RepID=A0ABP8FF93_9BACT